MADYYYDTWYRSGAETFEAGQPALDLIQIPAANVIAAFPTLQAGDKLHIRQKSGLRRYVPELCWVAADASVTGGSVTLAVDANTFISPAAFASAAVITYPTEPAANLFIATEQTPDTSSDVTFVIGAGLSPPVLNAPSTATTGGTLAAGTYYYKLTAINASGETLASNEVSEVTTGTTSTVTNTWTAIGGATGYKLYRGTAAGAEVFLTALGAVTTYTDTGSLTPGAATPPVVNQTANLAGTGNVYVQLATTSAARF